MKNNLQLLLIVLLAMGCGASGAMLAQRQTAQAQGEGYSYCFVADFNSRADGSNPEEMAQGRGGIQIPAGLTPIGGTGGLLILCR